MISLLCFVSALFALYALIRLWREPHGYFRPWLYAVAILAVAGLLYILHRAFAGAGPVDARGFVAWLFSSERLAMVYMDVRNAGVMAQVMFWAFILIAYLTPPGYELKRRAKGA